MSGRCQGEPCIGAVILSGDVYEPPILYQTLPIGNACRPVRLCTLALGRGYYSHLHISEQRLREVSEQGSVGSEV